MLKSLTKVEAEKLLKTFKRANKVARVRMSNKYGHCPDDFQKILENMLVAVFSIEIPESKSSSKKSVSKPIIHDVDILDQSGSMIDRWRDRPDKLAMAIEGISKGISDLKENKEATFTKTLVCFGSGVVNSYKKVSLDKAFAPFHSDLGSTALYQAVGETLENLLKESNGKDKYLVKIFTDGGENASHGKYRGNPILLGKLIKECETKGFTITFVGTRGDVKRIVDNLNIDESNTLVHDNTSEGVRDAFIETRGATICYAQSVAKGEDVTRGFYKKVGKL
jgi:hypothetical protein